MLTRVKFQFQFQLCNATQSRRPVRTCDAKADYTLHDTSVNLPCQISGPEARVYDCHTAPSSPTQSPDRSHSCRDLGNARGNGVICKNVIKQIQYGAYGSRHSRKSLNAIVEAHHYLHHPLRHRWVPSGPGVATRRGGAPGWSHPDSQPVLCSACRSAPRPGASGRCTRWVPLPGSWR